MAGNVGIGKTVLIRGSCSILNDSGGTTMLSTKVYRVAVVTKKWHDYETGWRYIGRFLDPRDIAEAREEGTTGFPPVPAFDPSVVYFSEWACVRDPVKNRVTT